MSGFKSPGVVVALPLVLGVSLAFALEARPILVTALIGGALALGRGPGLFLGIGSIGLLCGWLRGPRAVEVPAQIDSARPVEARVVPSGGWRNAGFAWTGEVQVETLRQGSTMLFWPARLRVSLGSPTPPERARRLRLRGYLRHAPPLGNDPALPAGPWRLQVKSGRLAEGIGERAPPERWAAKPRRWMEGVLQRAGPPSPGTRLAAALILGDPTRLDRELVRGLRRCGLGHLLAVSGLHIGILATLLWLAARPLPRVAQTLAPIAGAGLYLLLVGPRPSILRAAIMVTLAGCALASERPPQSINSLAWALALIVVLDPTAPGDLGFALTAAATTGIVLLAPPLAARWTALPRWLARALGASVGANLATLPWTLATFHLLTPLAIVFNLVAVPWTALLLAVSFLWALAAVCLPAILGPLGGVLDLLAEPYAWPALLSPVWTGTVPSDLGWWGGAALAACLAYASLGLLAVARLLALVLAVALVIGLPASQGLEIVMLDVGQGEAILIRDGERAALIDGGGWRRRDIAQEVLVPTLARLGVRRLDALVLSHPDLDHCGGLREIGGYLPVDEVWSASGLLPGACAAGLIGLPGVRWRPLWRGRTGSLGRWRFEVLHPAAGTRGAGNERSLLMRVRAGNHAVLLTGDLGSRTETVIVREQPAALRASILKVGHHGSRSSTTAAFLGAVAPRLALVSAGRGNIYGHPAGEVLDRLESRGIRVLRTDRDGMISLRWPASATE